MTGEEEQHSNLRWFVDLLARPLETATGLRPEPFVGASSSNSTFSRKRFFELSGIELDPHARQFHYDHAAIREESRSYLASFIAEGDVVVAYELSEQTRQTLDSLGITYVDIWLHPLRYLDDILFAFSSNDERVFGRIVNYSLDEEHFRLYADRARISTYKGFERVNLPVAPDSALFVGQTLEDKAICRNTDGRMLTLLDYKEQFEAAGQRHSVVYYSRHPYVKRGDEQILEYVRTCGFAEVVAWPAYQMLAHPGLRHVFSISSSVVYEARYFGKETRFLYRPVIDLRLVPGLRNYASIFQEFVSGHFWSDVLEPVVHTKPCPRIVFMDPKDKLRDMLGFYWSYRHVDKIESMRQELAVVGKRARSVRKQLGPIEHGVRQPSNAGPEIHADIRAAIDSHKVVSFDVFDTLLIRPLARPEDLFDLLRSDAQDISAGRIRDFRSVRTEAKKWVRNPARGEEVLLTERYDAIRERFDLTQEQGDRLLALELDTERRLIRRREFVNGLFGEAKAAGKKVVLASDTYFDRAFVEELLHANGIEGYDALFVSSEVGLLKHTGRMFEHMLQHLQVEASDVCHIGDNPHSDGEQAALVGMDTVHLPRPAEALDSKTLMAEQIQGEDSTLVAVVKGMAANKIADDPFSIERPSFVGGDAEALGYCLAGPLFLGFAKWVLESALEDGVNDLYFLARDGDIAKKAYDHLAPLVPGAPASHYSLASRRAITVAALGSREDVGKMLEANFSPTSLGGLLQNRFGLKPDDVVKDAATRHGFFSTDSVVRQSTDLERLRSLVDELADPILENAAEERRLLMDYYREQGLGDEGRRQAVVDIGHHGTMQLGLSCLLESKSLGGYYFALFDGAAKLCQGGLPAAGYLGDDLDGRDRGHPYVRHLLMFELLFLNDQGSFVRFEQVRSQRVPRMLSLEGEERRVELSRQVHRGAERFVADAVSAFGPRLMRLAFGPEDMMAPLTAMLRSPTSIDARPFVGVPFENAYSGRDRRFVIHPDAPEGRHVASSLWLEGAEASVSDRPFGRQVPWPMRVARWSERLGLLSDRKARKLERSPRDFFQDSRNPLMRSLGRLVRE